jgi:hypothetical protein
MNTKNLTITLANLLLYFYAFIGLYHTFLAIFE